MRCKSIKKRLALYISDDLTQRWKEKIEAHLGSCPACQQELKNLKDSLARIKAADSIERQGLPDWDETSWAGLMERISRIEVSRKGRPGLTAELWKKYAGRAAAVAGLFLVALLAYFLINRFWLNPARLQIAKKEDVTTVEEKVKTDISQKEESQKKLPEVAVKKEKEIQPGSQTDRSEFFKIEEAHPKEQPSEKVIVAEARPEGILEKQPGSLPDRIEMVFKLPESGVQVVWILDRNFNLEGVKK
jgi:hypothetical protein